MTLIVSPSSLAPGVSSAVSIRIIDTQKHAIAGARISFTGAGVAVHILSASQQPFSVHITPQGSGPVLVAAESTGFSGASTSIQVVAPVVPATVTGLLPEMGILASGVQIVRQAKLNDPLFVQWRATTNATERGSLTFADGSVLHLDHSTVVTIKSAARLAVGTGQVLVEIVSGGQAHDMETGTAIAASLGTRYAVRVLHGHTTFSVLAGRLVIRNHRKVVSLGAGQESGFDTATAPSAPSPISQGGPGAWAVSLPSTPAAGTPAFAYLLRNRGHQLDIFSIDKQVVVQSLQLPAAAIGDSLAPDGKTVLLATSAGVLAVPSGGGAVRAVSSVFKTAALSPMPGGLVAVADVTHSAITIVDTASGATVRTMPLGYPPTGIAASWDGLTGVVTAKGHVALVDLQHGSVISDQAVVGVPGRPAYAMDSSVGLVPLPSAGALLELSAASGSEVGRIPLGRLGGALPSCVAGPDGRVYVANSAAGSVDVVDPVRLRVLARYRVGAHPLGIALAPDGKIATVTSNPSEFLILDPVDGFVLSRLRFANLYVPLTLVSAPVLARPDAMPAGSATYGMTIASSARATGSTPTATPTIARVPRTVAPSATPSQVSYSTATSTVTSVWTATPRPSTTPSATPTYNRG